MRRYLLPLATASLVGLISQSLILAACTALGMVAIQLELKRRQEAKLHDLVKRNWAEVVDSLFSAGSAGLGPVEALGDLAQIGPIELRSYFAEVVDRLDKGESLADSITWLKQQLADAHADRTLELIQLTNALGAKSYLETLKSFGAITRAQIALDGELAAKQGWIKGTAKLAVASPWIIVLMLSGRPENAVIYNSPGGLVVLCGGLVVCLVAYRLIHSIGEFAVAPRVFAS